MSTRRKSRRNTRKSRKQLLKGGGGAAWHSDPSKSFEELVSEFRPPGTDRETGYALDADLVADYYWNKAMTQLVETPKKKDMELSLQKIIHPETVPTTITGALVNKGNSSASNLIKNAKAAAKTDHAKQMKTNVFNMMKDFIKKYNDHHSTELKIKANSAEEEEEEDGQIDFLTAREQEDENKKNNNWHTVPDTGGYLLGKTLDSIGNFIWQQREMWPLRIWGSARCSGGGFTTKKCDIMKVKKKMINSVKDGGYHYGLNGMAGFENCAKLLSCCQWFAHPFGHGMANYYDDTPVEERVPDFESKINLEGSSNPLKTLNGIKASFGGKGLKRMWTAYDIDSWTPWNRQKRQRSDRKTIVNIKDVERIYKHIIKSYVNRYYGKWDDKYASVPWVSGTSEVGTEDRESGVSMENYIKPLEFSPYISYEKVEELLKKDPSGENTGIKTEAKTTEGGRKGRRRKRRTRRKGKSQRKKRTRRRKKRRR
jgi:hypothetical protein